MTVHTMTIKRKIKIAQTVICLTLLIVGFTQVWKLQQTRQSLNYINTSVETLGNLERIRSLLHHQEQKIVHYLIWRHTRDQNEFLALEDELGRLTRQLRQKFSSGSLAGSNGAISRKFVRLESLRTDVTADVLRFFALMDAGQMTLARATMEEQIEETLWQEIYPLLDDLIEHQVIEIQLAYHESLSRASFSAWLNTSVLDNVALASQAIDYSRTINDTASLLESQGKELLEYIESGDPEQLAEYRFFARSALEQIPRLKRFAARQQHFGREEEAAAIANLEKLGVLLKTANIRFTEVINRKGSDSPQPDLDVKVGETHDFIHDQIFPLLDIISKDAQAERKLTHERLLRTTTVATGIWAAVLVAILLALIVVSFRIGNRILGSLELLGEGTDRIRRGDLNHRIVLPEQDEFGRLANEFNQMALALQDSRGELERFVYITSHDLRAPLLSLQGFVYELRGSMETLTALLDTRSALFDDSAREQLRCLLRKNIPEALQFIESATVRMERQVNALLKLCRAGQMGLRPIPVKLTEVVDMLITSVAHQIADKQVSVHVEPLPEVVADPHAVEQILGNLIDNALKYLDPGRPGAIHISAACHETGVVIRVQDNGQGIAPEDQKRIFEVFQRGNHTDTPGEGLGLAYVNALLKRLGGEIWCDSIEGRGSTFSFTLPITRLAADPTYPAQSRGPS